MLSPAFPLLTLGWCGSGHAPGALADRFQLHWRVLGEPVEATVLFQAADPAAPPDFVFPPGKAAPAFSPAWPDVPVRARASFWVGVREGAAP